MKADLSGYIFRKFLLFLALSSVLAGYPLPVAAQSSGNPFDIAPRLKSSPADTSKSIDAPSGNPFEIIKKAASADVPLPAKQDMPAPSTIPTTDRDDQTAEKSATEPSKGPLLFGIIVGMLILLALMITLLRPFIVKVFKGFFNDNLLHQLHREQGALVLIPYQLLYLMFVINTGIFIFLLLQYLDVHIFQKDYVSWLSITALIAAMFLVKHILLLFLGWLFPIGKEMKVYSFTIVVFNIVIGILIVPFNVAIAYGPPEIAEAAVWLAIGILVLVYAFRSLRGLFIAGRFLALHKLHFLFYLCAVEIAPVLVFIKWIMLNTGV